MYGSQKKADRRVDPHLSIKNTTELNFISQRYFKLAALYTLPANTPVLSIVLFDGGD
jgi:hypothetical protein